MKRAVAILLLVMMLLLAVMGCSSRETPFLGKWNYDMGGGTLGMYYIFEKKGVLKAQTVVGEQNGKPELDYGSYKVVDEDTMMLTDTTGVKSEYTYLFEEDGTKLTISDAEYIMSFTKVATPEN